MCRGSPAWDGVASGRGGGRMVGAGEEAGGVLMGGVDIESLELGMSDPAFDAALLEAQPSWAWGVFVFRDAAAEQERIRLDSRRMFRGVERGQQCSPQPSPHYQPDSGYIIAWAVVVCSGHHPPRRHPTFSNSQVQIEPHSSHSEPLYVNLYLHQTPSRNAWPSPSSWGLVTRIWFSQRPFAAVEGIQMQPHLVVGHPAESQIRRQICCNLCIWR
ncbi:hypothetical protein DL98DRAFT_538972 [Cadophora sp. DSE1049]|nr:hypothetical protein DL98DRAFT_538972 [Cadophora sp. DSE1049]